jgi:hypothetical protein
VGAVEEEVDRWCVALRAERSDPPDLLAVDAEPLSAGDQEAEGRVVSE